MDMTIAQIIYSAIGLFYVVYLVLYATFMLASVIIGAFDLYDRDKTKRVRNEIKHEFAFPVSILVPAYNEEVTILASIESLLALDYMVYEIIVVDDGSRDKTAAKMVEYFSMLRVDRPIMKGLPCQSESAVYEAKVANVHLTLISKLNGGKGDALNMGINASRYPYFLCIDADSVLQRDALKRITQPVLEDDSVMAVGGMIRAAQCAVLVDGVVQDFFIPNNVLIAIQAVEYERSFLSSRIMMDRFNGNLIISGALGLFKKDVVVAAGGYDVNTLGEDMELVMKLHVFCRNHSYKYSIRYEPDAICWSQVPSRFQDIRRQRRRWHLGLFQSMMKYRLVLGDTRYGLMGLISYLYYLLYELFSPIIELLGILVVAVSMTFGLINPIMMLWFLLLYGIYGAILTMTAFFQRTYIQNLKMGTIDILKVLTVCVLESMLFRYMLSYVRATAFLSYHKHKRQWGVIKRDKVNTGKAVK